MRLALVVLLLPAMAGAAPLTTPAQAIAAAARDARGLDPHIVLTSRYLSLHFLPEKDLKFARRILQYQCGLLNRRPTLPRLYEVPDTAGTLLRLDLRTLALKRTDLNRLLDVWEQLAHVDPLYHYNVRFITYRSVRRLVPVMKGQQQVSKKSKRSKRPAKARKVKTVPVLADWLSADPRDARAINDILLYSHKGWHARYRNPSAAVRAIEDLVFRTGSAVPIVDGTWFFQQTAIAADRDANNPGYDEFLGIKNQDDYEKLIGFSKKQTDDFTRSLLEATKKSDVKKDGIRRIEVRQKPNGFYWLTFDAIKAKNEFNPLRVVNGTLKFNATETIGQKADGILAFGLFNNNRENQRSAPDFVGYHHGSLSNNGRIEKPFSCIDCHGNGGLKDIKVPFFRKLFDASPQKFAAIMKANLPVLALGSPDPDELAKLQDQYLRPLEPAFEDSRKIYERACFEITDGWDSKTLAKRYKTAYHEWYDTDIDLKGAALRFGVSQKTLTAGLAKLLKDSGSVDSVLAVYLRPEEDKENLPFDAFWEAYALGQFALRGRSPLDFISPEDDRPIRRGKR